MTSVTQRNKINIPMLPLYHKRMHGGPVTLFIMHDKDHIDGHESCTFIPAIGSQMDNSLKETYPDKVFPTNHSL